ncbi:MAG: sugar transferase [Nitrospiria bacterium]
MLKQKAKLIAISLYLTEIGILTFVFFLSFFLRDVYLSPYFGPVIPLQQILWLLYVILPVWSILLFYFRTYESQRTKSLLEESWKITGVSFFGPLILMSVVFLLKAEYVSRLFIGIFGITAWIFLVLERCFLRLWARYVRRKGYNYRNIIIVGTGRRAREMKDLIDRHKEWGLRLAGFVSDQPDIRLRQIKDVPVLGAVADLPQMLEQYVIDELIFAVSRKRLEKLEEIFLLCEEQGICTRIAVNFFPHMLAKVHLDEFHGVPLLTFTTTPHNEFLLMTKRLFDLVIGFVLILALLPVSLLVILAVKSTSKGPVFFTQTRVGLNGRHFTLYKFRSMCHDALKRQEEVAHLNEMKGPAFKAANDPRLTPIGCFIRRMSLDEIPQLYNVLIGDMSIVGPRPPLPEEVTQYKRWHRRRLSMKPGLTCLWQIGGRNKIRDFKEWMELDLRYIDNWSLKLDMKIFLKTIVAVLAGRGAS